MFENLRLLYRFYGAYGSILQSAYFWFSILCSFFIGFFFSYGDWFELAHSTLPSLTGFSIAAFAIIFAVLDRKQVAVLLTKSHENDIPPLLTVASAICHAVFVQILTIVFAGIAKNVSSEPLIEWCCELPPPEDCSLLVEYLVGLLGFLGHFMLFYSWFLVLAAALSILRMMVIVSGSKVGK